MLALQPQITDYCMYLAEIPTAYEYLTISYFREVYHVHDESLNQHPNMLSL